MRVYRGMFDSHILAHLLFRRGVTRDPAFRSKKNWELANAFGRWLATQQYEIHTIRAYNRVVRDFCQLLGRKHLRRATHTDVRAYLTAVLNRLPSVDNAGRHLSVLRLFYDFLYLGGAVDAMPPRVVVLRKPRRNLLPKVLSETQVCRLIEATNSPRDRAIIELLYATGCRPGELINLQLSDVNFKDHTIRVGSKGGERRVFFGNSADAALRAYLGSRRHGYIFEAYQRQPKGLVYWDRYQQRWRAYWTDYSGGVAGKRFRCATIGKWPMTRAEATEEFERMKKGLNMKRPVKPKPAKRHAIANVVRSAATKAGLGYVRPYMLRHSFATHLLDHGADSRYVQQLLGHVKLDSTQIYERVSNTTLKSVYAACHPRK